MKTLTLNRWNLAVLITVLALALGCCADESKRRGGVPVSLPDVLAKARTEAAQKK